MKTSDIIENQILNPLFPVIAIGTTSAEIETLKKIISDFPFDSEMAYIVMENLSAPQSDNLAEILSEFTKIPVIEIVNTIHLLPNHIYVIPENNFVVVENGILNLKPKTRSSRVNNCLDIFFEAIANTYQSYTVGLLLSWTNSDGAAGLKKLKELGGSTVAVPNKKTLSPITASDFIDYFTTPQEASSKLLQIHQSYLVNHAYVNEEIKEDEEELFNQIINLIYLRTGTNFHQYKHQTLRRRIAKRMVITRQNTTEKYLKLLEENTTEQDSLFNDILIPVTYFFRDEPFFSNLSKNVFPDLMEIVSNKTLRVWCAGCSTGEEAYSLAICINEYLQQTNNSDIKVQILASDLSEKCISKARSGIYTPQDVKNISSERLADYFIKRDSNYYVTKTIRDMCVFAVHDLTKDAPFAKIDFISCRNVLIYFDTHLQNQVFGSFHYALKDKGFLFLGKSESPFNVPHLFNTINRQEKIYSRKKIISFDDRDASPEDYRSKRIINENLSNVIIEKDFRKIASDILLQQFSPAAVIINEDLEIVHFHGDTSLFLQPPAGKPSFNILDMVRDEIGFNLRNGILKARNEKKNFSGEYVLIKSQSFLTSFEVIYLPLHPELLLIIFWKKTIEPVNPKNTGSADQNRIQELERELAQLQGDFKRVTEEQHIYFEELQTTNEELLSNTEELRHINDQLEVSAEELQSNNEELSCLNDELRDRREELTSMQNFYESILKTIREPLLIIDKNYIIKSANPSFYNTFKTQQEETEGYSIFEIGSFEWNIAEFKEAVLKKIADHTVVENFRMQFNFGTSGKKIMMTNATPIVNSIPDGMILIAFEDITALENTSESLKIQHQEMYAYSRQLESFTAVAGNNLLEPIRKIYMFGKKVLDNETSLSEAGIHNTKRLLSSAVNMTKLIEDLIDYSKVNFTEKQFKKTDLNLLLKKTINDLKGIIQQSKAMVTIDSLLTVNVMPAQIQQLFIHLISNAIKHTKENSIPEIKIGMEPISIQEISELGADPDINYIKLFISDNGIGFSKNFETLIFQPFYKLHSNDKHYSSGLGLAAVQKIVSNHKGFIRVSSEPGQGTIFFIYLPY